MRREIERILRWGLVVLGLLAVSELFGQELEQAGGVGGCAWQSTLERVTRVGDAISGGLLVRDHGEEGNRVLAGHRDTSFAFLRRLAPGDELALETVAGVEIVYRVVASRVVDQDALWVTAAPAGRWLTLVTCYPFHDPVPGSALRYVVRATADEAGGGPDEAVKGWALASAPGWSMMPGGGAGSVVADPRSDSEARTRSERS